jgi:predicted GIY-YIG superfamily endonuclease
MIIYKITNVKNGKFYIGKTTRTLNTSFKEHCRGSDKGYKKGLS